ncbi:MAG: acetyl-CoA carboxylase biotin carboxyl carrier protein [Ruminococcus sp.]|nr:acetyl-CoA carboxylase biotin carboxyl carrier protein [Ruminococcus sp.]
MGRLGFDLTFENIERLADIINAKELSEFTFEEDDFKFTIKGKKCPPPAPYVPAVTAAAAAAPAASAPAAVEASAPAVSGREVKAPIVGTFYAAPSPDSAPFVSVGDKVKKGDVIFIIESMKVMSEVQSEFDGVVKEVCVNSGDAVEFDQTVMIIG